MKIAIIGATASGLNVATKLRRLDENIEIKIFEKDSFFASSKCCIPYYLSGNTDFEGLTGFTTSELNQLYNIDVLLDCEVNKIFEKENKIGYLNKNTGEMGFYEYDKLVLATGTKPNILKCENIDKVKNLYQISNITDAKKILEQLQIKRKILVIGGGIIGLEVVDALVEKEHRVSIVDQDKSIPKTLDFDMAYYVEEILESAGVLVYLNRKIAKFSNDGKKVFLDNGNEISFDLAIYAIGAKPDVSLLKGTKIKIGKTGGIVVNSKFQTTSKNIYAIGDVCEDFNFITKKKALNSNALVASKNARKLARIILGYPDKNDGFLKTGIMKLRNFEVAWCGLNEDYLLKNKIKYETIRLHLPSITSCYKNINDLKIKILFSKKNKKIFGAQVVGESGADKFIDIISSVVKLDNNILRLKDLEISYAPPYNTVKPAIIKVGYIAEGIIEGLSKREFISYKSGADDIKNVLDIRDEIELRGFEIAGALNIPLPSLRDNLDKLKNNESFNILCKSGKRAYIAEQILRSNNIKSKIIDGGEISLKALKNKKCKGE